MNNQNQLFTVIIILLIFIIIYLYMQNPEAFEPENTKPSDTLVIKTEEIKNKIQTELESSLTSHATINLPLVLNDNNNICSQYKKNKEICLPGAKPNDFFCQNYKLGTTKASPKESCNNWVTPDIQQNQTFNLNTIINQSLNLNMNYLVKELSEYDPYVLQNKKLLEQIKQKKILSNTQNYLLSNNEQNVSSKEVMIKEINDKNEEYDNNITSSYYTYQEELKKMLMYQKYNIWCKYLIYFLLIILVIVIILNFLFTTT